MAAQAGESGARRMGRTTARSEACKVLVHLRERAYPELVGARSAMRTVLERSGADSEAGTREETRARELKVTASKAAKATPGGPRVSESETRETSRLGGRGGALLGRCRTLLMTDLLERLKL